MTRFIYFLLESAAFAADFTVGKKNGFGTAILRFTLFLCWYALLWLLNIDSICQWVLLDFWHNFWKPSGMFADLKEEKSIWEEMFKMFMSVNICKYFSSSLAQKTWQCIFVKIMVKILANIKWQLLEYVLAKKLPFDRLAYIKRSVQNIRKINICEMLNIIKHFKQGDHNDHDNDLNQGVPWRRLLLPVQRGHQHNRAVWVQPHPRWHPLSHLVTLD